jgi:hypothetical protein
VHLVDFTIETIELGRMIRAGHGGRGDILQNSKMEH